MKKVSIYLRNFSTHITTITCYNHYYHLFVGGMLVVSVSVAGLVTLAAMTQPALAPEAKHSLLQYVTGKYLLPSNCRVHFEWEEPQLVGGTMTFNVKVRLCVIHMQMLSQLFFFHFFLSNSYTIRTIYEPVLFSLSC